MIDLPPMAALFLRANAASMDRDMEKSRVGELRLSLAAAQIISVRRCVDV